MRFEFLICLFLCMPALASQTKEQECAKFWLEKGIYSQDLDPSRKNDVAELYETAKSLDESPDGFVLDLLKKQMHDLEADFANYTQKFYPCYEGSRLQDEVKQQSSVLSKVEEIVTRIETKTELNKEEEQHDIEAFKEYKAKYPTGFSFADDTLKIEIIYVRSTSKETMIKFEVQAFQELHPKNTNGVGHPAGASLFDGLGHPLILKKFLPVKTGQKTTAKGSYEAYLLVFEEETVIITKNVELVLDKGSVGNDVPIHFLFSIEPFKK